MEDMNLPQEIHWSMIANLTQPVLQMMIHHWGGIPPVHFFKESQVG